MSNPDYYNNGYGQHPGQGQEHGQYGYQQPPPQNQYGGHSPYGAPSPQPGYNQGYLPPQDQHQYHPAQYGAPSPSGYGQPPPGYGGHVDQRAHSPYPPNEHERGHSPYPGGQAPPRINEPGQGPPGSDADLGGADGERGMGKTLLGGIAGSYLGHKAGGHGIIGALGGAIGAHLLDKRHEDKKKHKHDKYDDGLAYGRPSSSHSHHSHHSHHSNSGSYYTAGSSAAMGGLYPESQYSGSSHSHGHSHHGHHKKHRHHSHSRSRSRGHHSDSDSN